VGGTSETVVAARGLAKRYGDVRAVDGVDLTVGRGEIYGFLGRNGAGKTTTIRMLLGLIRPTAGEVRLFGERVVPGTRAVFQRVGYLVETATAYANLTVAENLEIQRRLMGVGDRGAVDEAIELLGLGEYRNRRAGRLSLGNKQRLSLARAMLHAPDLLVLDEPANALDPAGIVEIRDLLRRLAAERRVTIFMSSHILAEVAQLATRIGIVHAGRVLEELDREQLRAKEHAFLAVRASDPARARTLLTDAGFTRIELAEDGRLQLFDAEDRAAEIAPLLVDAGIALTELALEREDLESYFLRLTEPVAGGER